jgi:GH24 family phage-related lysozyme (muramidase)
VEKVEAAKEAKAKRHRLINTVLMFGVLAIAIVAYFKVPEYMDNQEYNSEIAQIMNDESLRLNVYNDSLGNATVGFGHLVLPGESFDKITSHEAIAMLRRDYDVAKQSVESKYKWATGDVKLVLINMTYQMGPSRLAKFEKALMALQIGDYDLAAAELLDSVWASQAPNRAIRIAGRILQLDNSFW